jgi:WD40 repeat protein
MPTHLYFNSDEEDAAVAARAATHSQAGPSGQQQQQQQRSAAQLFGQPAGCRHASKAGSVRVDYAARDQCYVFKVLASPDHSAAAASLSNNTLKVYGIEPARLTHTADLKGHTRTITDLQFPDPAAPYAAFTSSADGTVRGWDLRSGQQAQAFQAAGHELLCFSMHEHLLAAGGQGDVLFWDKRSSKQLASFTDTHMDDVTQVGRASGVAVVVGSPAGEATSLAAGALGRSVGWPGVGSLAGALG